MGGWWHRVVMIGQFDCGTHPLVCASILSPTMAGEIFFFFCLEIVGILRLSVLFILNLMYLGLLV